ncbi:RHS repeat-associated core domain-containing protein [Weeksellaceae bacterium A-14]
MEYGVTGLGSAAIGNFTDIYNTSAIYQVRKGTGYSIPGLSNVENNSGTSLFSGKVLDLNNKLTLYDQVIVVNEKYPGVCNSDISTAPENQNLVDNIVFDIRDISKGTGRKVTVPVKGGVFAIQNYVPTDPYDNPYGEYYETYERDQTRRNFVQGDFNNDGLTDFLIVESSNLNRTNRLYLIELGKQNSGQDIQVNPIILNSTLALHGKDIYPIEFDGDGILELMVVDKLKAKYSIYKINFSENTLSAIEENKTLSNFNDNTPIFFGDFNGDGITDFLTPQKVYEIPESDNSGLQMGMVYNKMQTESLLWWKYLGNGKTFLKNQENYTDQKIAYLKPSQSNYIKKSSFWQKFWNGKPDSYQYTRYSSHNISIVDFNNDGRSDIIMLNKIGRAKYNSNGMLNNVPIENLSSTLSMYGVDNYGATITVQYNSVIANKVSFFENQSLQGGTFKAIVSVSIADRVISPLSLIVPKISFDKLNVTNSAIQTFDMLANDGSITYNNDNFLEKQIQEVNNGSDVIQKIEYRNMLQKFLANSTNLEVKNEATYLYKPLTYLTYPYFVHQTNSSVYLVSKIHTLFEDKILTREYRYENGIQEFSGKGFLGFQKLYSSDAYESEYVNNKYQNKNPVKAVFWNIVTKDPLFENAVVKTSYGGISKFFTENIITNKKYEKGNHQYLILSTDEISKDYLKKITISKKYVYDESDDLKLKKAYTDFDGIGATISSYTYKTEFSNGEHYFYGKIESLENVSYKDGLSFGSREETTYYPLNGAIKSSEKYGNDANAPPVITSYTYDSKGNILTQTLSATGTTSQTTVYGYDDTGRYVNKTTTPDGLQATSVVDAMGRVKSEISSLGLSTSYSYDTWGNITEITDYLGKKTTISKSIAENTTKGIYNLHKKREGGAESIVTFDSFDREVQSKTKSINDKWVVLKTEYDVFGRKVRISEPFFEGDSPKWNTIEYDELSRPVKNVSFTGKTITTCYEGMKVTVDDGYQKTSKTLDAMGNTIRHQDHGGVINYSYYPNGALRETNYEGIKTSVEIDGWGNKAKITDPSAGIFTYQYDNLSRLIKEETPKGKTLFTYDDLGRPQTETTTGKTAAENTNITKTYEYDSQTKLPVKITGSSNGKSFTYTTSYDNYKRIKGKTEQTPDFTYTSSTTFDSYGRADEITISATLQNPSYTTTSKIKNAYDTNGILIQQNDVDTGKTIWHISSVNAQGQTTKMEYGNGYDLTNTYDQNYSLEKINHTRSSSGVNLLDIDYDYDTKKGVLNSRNFNNFSKSENFTYDKLNRLLSEAVNGIIINQYTYDNRGRLTSNSELGKYNYNSTDYKLQNINFNTSGQSVNTKRGFPDVTYNAFKSPLSIILAGKENLSFEYNILQTRYSMVSSVTGKQKYYSSDFAIEIVKESSGKTQIITYITGDPYSANYIKKEVLTNGSLTEKANYFLHRDNLGSIVAITKADGTMVERRYFDAWGNLRVLEKSNGQKITDMQQLMTYDYFLDRGYTGHEHLWRAGLINMNARLYDPILRKFLSVDNVIQDPYNTQNYDRYSYVLNNPLLYMDISGNELFVGTAILIGLAVGIFAKGIANMISGIPFWYGIGKAGFMGAISGAISFGIGSLATSQFGALVSVGKAAFEAGLHAISSGAMSAIEGGKFFAGALSGFVSSAISSGIEALGVDFSASKASGKPMLNGFGQQYMRAVMIASGGFSGGISSIIAGGKFIDGFKQGLITSGLNHVAHLVAAEIEYRRDLTKQFNEQLRRTKDYFSQRKAYYDKQISELKNSLYATTEMYETVEMARLEEFYQLVKTGSPYDIKNNPKSIFSNAQLGKEGAIYNGESFRVDDFGNYNFGVAAKAYGYSLNFSRVGAGLYQIYSRTSNINWISSYFDDPRDYMMIGKGYNHFK